MARVLEIRINLEADALQTLGDVEYFITSNVSRIAAACAHMGTMAALIDENGNVEGGAYSRDHVDEFVF